MKKSSCLFLLALLSMSFFSCKEADADKGLPVITLSTPVDDDAAVDLDAVSPVAFTWNVNGSVADGYTLLVGNNWALTGARQYVAGAVLNKNVATTELDALLDLWQVAPGAETIVFWQVKPTREGQATPSEVRALKMKKKSAPPAITLSAPADKAAVLLEHSGVRFAWSVGETVVAGGYTLMVSRVRELTGATSYPVGAETSLTATAADLDALLRSWGVPTSEQATVYWAVRSTTADEAVVSETRELRLTRLAASKDQFHLYLLIGQSNMAGSNTIEAEDLVEDPRILSLDKNNAWQVAKAPLYSVIETAGKGQASVGPGLSFAREMIKDCAPDVKIGLIPCAVHGSGIASWAPGMTCYNPISFGDYLPHPYDDAVARARVALQTGVLKGILWHQGEADSNASDAASYNARLTQLIARLRSEFGAPNLPFVAGEIGYFYVNVTFGINDILRNAVGVIPYYDLAPSDGLTSKGDNLHFSAAAQRTFGKRYAAKMRQMPYPAVELTAPANNTDVQATANISFGYTAAAGISGYTLALSLHGDMSSPQTIALTGNPATVNIEAKVIALGAPAHAKTKVYWSVIPTGNANAATRVRTINVTRQ